MRMIVLAFLLVFSAIPVKADNPSPHSGMVVLETGQPFAKFVQSLSNAIKKNKMGIVAQACATCGAKSIGVTIPGNQIFMVFRPDFAVRMLKASEAAGIEAPLRLYITERADGSARLTYRKPNHVFGAYEVPELDRMAAELDQVFEKIATDALAGS